MGVKARFQAKNEQVKSNLQSTAGERLEILPDGGDQKNLIHKINTYHRINNIFQTDELSLGQLMNGLLQIAVESLNSEGGCLWIYDYDKKNLCGKVVQGKDCEQLKNSEVRVGKGVVGWVQEHNQAAIVNDTASDNRFSNRANMETYSNIKSLLAAPLMYKGENIGVMEIINKKEGHQYNDGDKFFLEDICVPCAMHIKTSRTAREQEKTVTQMNTFKDLHEVFASTLELNKLLSIVLSKAINIVNGQVGSIWLADDIGEGIECKVAVGPTKDKVMGVRIKKGVGIVGWTVENNQSQIVEDCSKDHRFSSAVDKKIDFVTKTMITVPLSVKQEVIGSLQVLNKKGNGALFDMDDLELLKLFASSSAMYIKNAKLFASEKKARELSALIKISKEISSTLDIDAVLMTVVNLTSGIVFYDEAGISVKKKSGNSWELRSISGEQEINDENKKACQLEAIHNKIEGFEKELYIDGRDGYQETSEMYIPEIKEYLVEHELELFWGYVLKDDQGSVGIFSFESKERGLVTDSKKELLSILIGQSTVALRNAELYNTIPSSQVLSTFKDQLIEKIVAIKDYPAKKLCKLGGSIAAVILSLIFIKIPYNVSANIEVVPVANTYYSEGNGFVKQVLVKEGQMVKEGDLLIRLDVTNELIQLKQKESTRQKVLTEMLKNRAEKKIAEYKIKENEWTSLNYEIDILKSKIEGGEIKASASGIVVSENLDDLIGMPVTFGQELIKVAKNDEVYLQFEVPENEILFVRPDQEIKFKVFSYPSHSFEGMKLMTVAGEGLQILETDPIKYFIARAQVKNLDQDAWLRPGMTGRGKIYADWQPLGYILFSKPWKFVVMNVLF